ncbi:DUF1304 domain-containing protein [Agrococcus casei]|uniref:DUF1304 domain-containing protein n=1 Tax=Agrococcus casei TaxID=343512 RepID=UPI003F8F2A20
MIIVALIASGLSALLHVYIFFMESVAWTSPKTQKTFGFNETDARTTKSLAFNQGFYNLFLAIIGVIGIVLVAVGQLAVGAALIFAGIGSMAAAALVLLLSSPESKGAAVKQGTLPLVTVVILALGLLI